MMKADDEGVLADVNAAIAAVAHAGASAWSATAGAGA